ncbi:VOC family protein [Leeia sp.]|uniref:VOC family protein n=1 Tax=Leeia sp. TaxID=2884678 RepID=UPI0035B0352A
MLAGLNHLTLATADLDRSFRFYVTLLGCRPHARWARGAYLSLPGLWLCLSLAPDTQPRKDYTHYAFSVTDFDRARQCLLEAGVTVWKDNHSEGDSLYFLDPDGHRLEIHSGDLHSRLATCQQQPYADMVFFD